MPRFLWQLSCAVLLTASMASAETPVKEHARAKQTPASEEPAAKEVPPYQGAAVVLVDVRYILERYNPLKKQVEDWRKEFDAARHRHEEELQAIVRMELYLNELAPDSTDHQRLEKEVVKRRVDTESAWKADERRFSRQRTTLFANAYRLIRTDVDEFIKEHKIVLALNFDGDPFPGRPLTIRQLSRQLAGGPSDGRITLSTGWDFKHIVVKSEVDTETISEESRPETNPQRVEHGLRGGVLGVQRSHDVTPYILQRLSANAAKVQTASLLKKEGQELDNAKRGAKREDEAKKQWDKDGDNNYFPDIGCPTFSGFPF